MCPLDDERWLLFTNAVEPVDIDMPKEHLADYYMEALGILMDIA